MCYYQLNQVIKCHVMTKAVVCKLNSFNPIHTHPNHPLLLCSSAIPPAFIKRRVS